MLHDETWKPISLGCRKVEDQDDESEKQCRHQVTYQVRPHLFRRHSRTSEARGLGGPSVLEVAHPRFLHMLEAVLEGIHRTLVSAGFF